MYFILIIFIQINFFNLQWSSFMLRIVFAAHSLILPSWKNKYILLWNWEYLRNESKLVECKIAITRETTEHEICRINEDPVPESIYW